MSQFERLRQARIEAGFKSGTDAAHALGISVATYNSHENGYRGLTVRSSEMYSRLFNVRSSWLLTGENPKHYGPLSDPDDDEPNERDWGKFKPGRRYHGTAENSVPELDPFGLADAAGEREVVATWSFPTDYVTGNLQMSVQFLFLLAVPDESASPAARTGDRAIVDASQTAFRGDGLYAVQGDDGRLYIRDLARVLFSKSPKEQVSVGAGKPGSFYSARFDELNIAGRVVGKIGRL